MTNDPACTIMANVQLSGLRIYPTLDMEKDGED